MLSLYSMPTTTTMSLLPTHAPRAQRRLAITMAWLALGSQVACSTADGDATDEPPVARLASGVVPGTDLLVATVYDESTDEAIAYFCGGDTTFGTHTRWFSGGEQTQDGFTDAQDDWEVTVEVDDTGATGTLTEPDGTTHAFTTTAVGSDSIAGLYSARVDDCTAGVVVVDEGGQARAQGTYFCTEPEFSVQVIILAPVALTPDGGIEVEVPLPEGTTTVLVAPV